MINSIKHHISVALCLINLAIKKQIEWILTFISFLVALPVKCATGLILIYVLVNKFSPLYGWSFNQLVFMYGLAYVIDGLAITFASQARKLETYIIRGDFDRWLVRPINVMFQFIFRYIYLGGLIDVLAGVIVLSFGLKNVGFNFTIFNIFKLILVIIGGTFIRISSLILVGSIAFWTKRNMSLVWAEQELVRRTTLFPITIYPNIFQALFTFVIPFAFISYYPSCDFFGFGSLFDLPLNLVIWTPVVGLILFIISNRIFGYGLKIYESAGA